MTGSNTDPVKVSVHDQAAAILLKLARPLFEQWMKTDNTDPLDTHYNAWFRLRTIAAQISERRETSLGGKCLEQLAHSLLVAHQLEHDAAPDGTPNFENCHCEVAEMIRDLAVMTSEAVVTA